MKKTEFTSIDFPKVDAENYDMHDADTLRRVFFKSDDKYAKLISKDIYFLIGAKGSGKTMYAKYLQFCDDSIDVEYYPIRTEDYLKFIEMFADGKLKYTDFKTIWKAILLVKLITSIEKNDIDKWPGKGRIYAPIAKLKESDILTKIVSDGFAPRTDEYSRTDGAELNFELGAEPDVIKSGISTKNSTETSLSSKTEYTVYLDRWNAFFNECKNAIGNLILKKPKYLIVDGIDVRPKEVTHENYSRCVTALIRAAYEINVSIFKPAWHSAALKILTLTRPDIFDSSGLNNTECVLDENAVVLKWSSFNSKDYRNSDLYKFVNQILSQKPYDPKIDKWLVMFGKDIRRGGDTLDAFEYCQRLTLARPRNFIKLFRLLKDAAINDDTTQYLQLQRYFNTDNLQKEYSRWFISCIRSELSYFCDADQYELFINFLKTFNNLTFSYSDFIENVNRFSNSSQLLDTFKSEIFLLNLMYQLNIVCYIQGRNLYHWYYREESHTNLRPDLSVYRIDSSSKFCFHWAVEKELGTYIYKRR